LQDKVALKSRKRLQKVDYKAFVNSSSHALMYFLHLGSDLLLIKKAAKLHKLALVIIY